MIALAQQPPPPGRVRVFGDTNSRRDRKKTPIPPAQQKNESPNKLNLNRPQGVNGVTPTKNTPATNQWKLERVELKDESEFFGVIIAESKTELEFAEIVRPKGRPMYVVIRPIPISEIADIDLLSATHHKELLGRVQRFKNRLRIEAGKMDDVPLSQIQQGNRVVFQFNGPWFQLTSSTDEVATRRCVVRIEQIFRAYRHVIRPRIEPTKPLHIVLYGSMDEYQGYLQRNLIAIKSPAFYSAAKNTILAGSDINRFTERVRQSQVHNKKIEAQYDQKNREFKMGLAKLFERMRANGIPDREIEKERVLRQASWTREYEAKMQEIKTADRRNSAKFNEVTRDMFTRIFHEAFHAYLNNFIIEDADRKVPRWLNEGLAQVFEGGQLDDGMLRIDAPNRSKLNSVKKLFDNKTAFPIADLLRAPNEEFLVTHIDSSSQQHYVQSWALTYYLIFNKNLLGDKLHRVAQRNSQDPFESFQALVNQPLIEVEADYREYLQALK
jgi:hypothetical protein